MKEKVKKKNNNKFTFNQKEGIYLFISLFLLLFSLLGIYFILFLPDFIYYNKVNNDNNIIEINDTRGEEDGKEEVVEINECPDCKSRFLDGILVKPEKANLYPVAIILDNEPKARPIQGIEKAALVYELPTEGASSRFLAVFNSDEYVDKVGPVRSARSYFIDLAQDSSALLIHCGGSPNALAFLGQNRIKSLNEFYFGSYFWRDKNLPAPHNIMIKSESWQKFLDNNGLQEVRSASWQFNNDNTEKQVNDIIDSEILVYYSKNYQSTWHYIEEGNYYRRDESDIKVKNLILHFASSQVIDEKLRLKIEMLGEGKAIICQNGICQNGTWRKNNHLERLRYFIDEKELVFEPGSTWISFISAGAKTNLEANF